MENKTEGTLENETEDMIEAKEPSEAEAVSEEKDALEAEEASETEEPSEVKGDAKKKKLPLWGKILLGVLAVVLVLAGGAYGAFHYLYHQMNIVSDDAVEAQEEYFDEDENVDDLTEVDPDSIQLDTATSVTATSDVINILICGEEAIGDDRGRTDCIMIATINRADNQLSLTSIMRDTYVSIPGFSDNKINAAYHNGGMTTLVETIKENFGIEVDGYVLVNFDSFEEIIDAIGGIDIELSSAEVSYLNSTNYISNYSYHTLSVGVNHMNGNQALGYARIRYVSKDGMSGDFARTLRHRTVMTAIYDKMMEKSTLELVAMIPKILPLLTTNLKKADVVNYLSAAVAVRDQNAELATLNVPVEGYYKITRVNGMSVVLASPLSVNVEQMQKFIYGSLLEEDGSLDSEANITVGQ